MNVIAVIGLGYVGLPLVVEFGRKNRTIGYDIILEKVEKCKKNIDPSKELSCEKMKEATYAEYTNDPNKLSEADIIIVAVPTPIKKDSNIPDFEPLINASKVISEKMKKGAIIVYESTVYPGATEEVCIPILEQNNKVWKKDFFVGYSPERINPGDNKNSLTNIKKVISADTKNTLAKIKNLYESIIVAGVYECSSIKVAEACKVIENTQRDINIALMNELAIICNKIGINTTEVLDAAETKWNFIRFNPGIVGGHCIGVDPYYLTYKAEMLGFYPKLILSGRQTNNSIPKYIADHTIKTMINRKIDIRTANIVILGLTFKENCSDIRNSKVFDIIENFKKYDINVFVCDPHVDKEMVFNRHGLSILEWDDVPTADVIIAAVPHDYFLEIKNKSYLEKLKDNSCFIDVKSSFNIPELEDKGVYTWQL